MAKQSVTDLTDQILTLAKEKGILQLSIEDNQLDGRLIHINHKEMINFGSCSYLGLERDERVIQGCVDATYQYGTQFSSSRAYLSSAQYTELETLLSQLFSAPVIVTATTTLAHISALPVIIKPGDLIVLDHQVHASVQSACKLLKAQGERIEMIRHNDLDHLERLIRKHRQTRGKIWYCIDGVYSMYGDLAPIDELYELMDKYPEFYLYADDAHGMSWCGQGGKGSIRGHREHHPQMVLTVSLNKAFGCAGGLLILPNREMQRKIRTCGGSLLFSGPIQPPLLGAAIASAKIHLSSDINELQDNLRERISYCRQLLQKSNLPDVANSDAPVFYIGVGEPNAGFNLVKRLHNDGFYVNIGLFPAVPLSNTGVRFTITNHITYGDIERLVSRITHHYPLALAEENVTSEAVSNAFKLPEPRKSEFIKSYPYIQESKLQFNVAYSIQDIKEKWEKIPVFKGTTGVSNLTLLENVFSVTKQQDIDHNHWLFQYITIKDNQGHTILLAFMTVCDIKTDMFARPELSELANRQRQEDPSTFISRCLMLGSPITEGTHMYLDENHLQQKEALNLFLKQIKYMQMKFRAEILTLRDFPKDSWIVKHIANTGFLVEKLPDTHYLENIDDFATTEYLSSLKRDYRKHWKKNILPYLNDYSLYEIPKIEQSKLDLFFDMYLEQQQNAKEISSFTLPRELLSASVNEGYWSCLELRYKNNPAACMFVQASGEELFCILLGVRSKYRETGAFRACLYFSAKHAQNMGLKKVHYGLTASLEKKRMGAVAVPIVALFRTTSNYQMETLESLSKSNFTHSGTATC
ncbi:aminotransferase class I/II-fold pyridoxal phosphate-dependent enzyme [Gynuella sp.]|uniref:aminotransferase class I/II-fold pyridoxal phosphate-dependent enzyme n=1 Tax=Gynuella sp. TaxID=2969146 RepID=UPI003D0BE2C9